MTHVTWVLVRQQRKLFSRERLLIANQALCHLENAFELTRQYTSERKAFGGSLSKMQTIRHKMADIKTDIVTCRVLVDECIQQFENVSIA